MQMYINELLEMCTSVLMNSCIYIMYILTHICTVLQITDLRPSFKISSILRLAITETQLSL